MNSKFLHALCVLIALSCIVSGPACQKTDSTPKKVQERWVLSNPESFKLKFPPFFFQSKQEGPRKLATCHTQGMEIVDDEIFITCCLYNPKQKMKRSFESDSILLKTNLSHILDRKKGPHIRWHFPGSLCSRKNRSARNRSRARRSK